MQTTSQPVGGILLGGILGNFIFGVTTAQTLLYFSRFPTDARRTRILVILVWIIEAVTMLASLAIEVISLIVGSSDPRSANMPWLQSLWVMLGSVLTGLVQGFYIWRLHRLTRNPYGLVALGLLFILKCVTSVFMTIWIGRGPEVLFRKKVWLVALSMGADATLDLVIAAGTATFLYRNRTGFESTDTAIARIAKYSISVGLLTGIASLITFVMFATGGITPGVTIIQMVAIRLHPMALLGSLHMRSSFKERSETIGSIHVSLSVIRRTDGPVPPPLPDSIFDVTRTAQGHEMSPISSDVKFLSPVSFRKMESEIASPDYLSSERQRQISGRGYVHRD